jgi:hypothetical protein
LDAKHGESHRFDLEMHVYIQCKVSSVEEWRTWIQGWNVDILEGKVMAGGFERNPEYWSDMDLIRDGAGPWRLMLTHGRHMQPVVRGRNWSFSGAMNVVVDQDDIDLAEAQKCSEIAFMQSFLRGGGLPTHVKYVVVLFRLDTLLPLTQRGSTASVELKGFAQTEQCVLEKCTRWLDRNADHNFKWRVLSRGLHGSREYEDAIRDALPTSNTPWLELLVAGTMTTNSARRGEDKQVHSMLRLSLLPAFVVAAILAVSL